MKSKQAVERHLKDFFKYHKYLPVPNFFIQGSYKTDTLIIKEDQTYDVDLGVYFKDIPDITPFTLQKQVYNAIYEHTTVGSKHKEKCIRLIYKGDYNIDLPVYYTDVRTGQSYLATKSNYIEDDSRALVDWFNDYKNDQITRLIKYMKAWSNHHRNKMPGGIVWTVWISKYYKQHKRDDIALYNTLVAIYNSFSWLWPPACFNPIDSDEDLLHRLDKTQKKRFKTELEELINALENVFDEPKVYRAKQILIPFLGRRFIN